MVAETTPVGDVTASRKVRRRVLPKLDVAVRFYVTAQQQKRLERDALDAGYNSVSDYVRSRLGFGPKR